MYSSDAEIDYYYIVAAAGIGKRMGLTYPKQFLEVDGKPIFIKTLEVIEKNHRVTGIVIVTNKEYISQVKKMCKTFEITKVIDVVSGGAERQDSIYNALQQIPKESIIGVQDGVRPFIEERYIEESYDKLIVEPNLDGVVVGVPVKDTIKENKLILYIKVNKEVSKNDLKDDLNRILPEYQIPQKIVFLDEFPLNSSGKISKKDLTKSFNNQTK